MPAGAAGAARDAVRRYRARISGPLLDRIDLHVDVPRLPPAELRPDAPDGESSTDVRARVMQARALQHSRAGKPNALLSQSETMATCRLAERDHALLERAVDALQLSARSIHRILRVARTIADLDDRPHILTAHLTEAWAIGARTAASTDKPHKQRDSLRAFRGIAVTSANRRERGVRC